MDKIIFLLSRLWLKFIGAQFKEIKTISIPDGNVEEVIIFTQKDKYFAQVTPFGTIIVSDNLLRAPVIILDSYLLHEIGHKKTNFVFKSLIHVWPAFVLLSIFIFQIADIYLLSMLFTYAVIKWISEIFAELYLAKFLGRRKYDEFKHQERTFFGGKIRKSRIGIIASLYHRPHPKILNWIIDKELKRLSRNS